MQINWLADKFDPYSGYGRMGVYLVRELLKCGVTVTPAFLSMLETPAWLRDLMYRVNFNNITITLAFGEFLPAVPGRHWGFTMYEDTSIPEGWAEIINSNCERLLVPCEHNAETFAGAGVKVPIHVVHGGTDPDEFPVLPRGESRPYTFMCSGDGGERKGIDVAWSAFSRAFEGVEDVRLIIKCKTSSMSGIYTDAFEESDSRIRLWKEDVDDLVSVYRQADCYVFPSYGEGWGMPPREAAMMGLPVITTRWSGLEVGIDQWAIPLNEYEMRGSRLLTKNACWAIPSIDECAKKMRWCYEHPDEARTFGTMAARWLREHQTWAHSAKRIVELLEIYS